MASTARFLLMILAWALVLPLDARGAMICDPESEQLFLSAGKIEDYRVTPGSRKFDTGTEGPVVVLECVSGSEKPPEEMPCGDGVQEIFLTWHAPGGQVSAVCMADTAPGEATPPADASGDGESGAGSGTPSSDAAD